MDQPVDTPSRWRRPAPAWRAKPRSMTTSQVDVEDLVAPFVDRLLDGGSWSPLSRSLIPRRDPPVRVPPAQALVDVGHAELVLGREPAPGVDPGRVAPLHPLADVEVLRGDDAAGRQVGRPPLLGHVGRPERGRQRTSVRVDDTGVTWRPTGSGERAHEEVRERGDVDAGDEDVVDLVGRDVGPSASPGCADARARSGRCAAGGGGPTRGRCRRPSPIG